MRRNATFLGASFPRFCCFLPSFEAILTCLHVRATRSPIPAVPMPPKKPSKSSNLQVVSSYNLRKVHIPYVCKDGTSSYQPRCAPRKAAILQESLLTLFAKSFLNSFVVAESNKSAKKRR